MFSKLDLFQSSGGGVGDDLPVGSIRKREPVTTTINTVTQKK
jgi:hypothetical protein